MDGKNGDKELAVPEPTGPGTSLILSKDHVGVVMNIIKTLTEGFKEWLEEDVDYTKELYGRDAKPALLDPGTFKMINFFEVRPKHRVLLEITETEKERERIKYVIAAELLNPKTGFIVAEGVGSCTTDEVKYQYRWLTASKLKNIHGYTDSEIAQLPMREIRPRGRGGKFPVYRIRNPDILDLDNTIVKMACKRCLGSTTAILVKTSQSTFRTNLSRMYTNYTISPNDVYVPGLRGQWRKIKNMVREEGRTVFRIDLADGSYLRATEDHEFPTTEGKKQVKNLKVDDVLRRGKINLSLGTAKLEYGWITGLYIAEGSPLDGGNAVQFTLNSREHKIMSKIKAIAEPLGSRVFLHVRSKSPSTTDVKVYGRAFSGLLRQFVNGKGASGKRLSKFSWSQGEGFLRQVLEGYKAGDTWTRLRRRTPRAKLGFTGKNRELAEDIRCLCAILNLRLKLTRGKQSDGIKIHSTYLGWITEKIKSYNQLNLEKITSIKKETKKAVVYDLDVDGDNLFLLANGIVSHNSEMDAALQLPGVSAVFTQDLGDQSAIRKQVESEAHIKQPEEPPAEEESREPERAHVGPPPRPTEESPDDVEKQKLPRGVGSLEELEYIFQERIPGYGELLQFVPVADGFSVEHRATLDEELEKLVNHMVTEMGGGRMKRGGLYGVDWVVPFRKTASST